LIFSKLFMNIQLVQLLLNGFDDHYQIFKSKYMKRFFILLTCLLIFSLPGISQEVEFNITLDRQQVPDLPKNITDDIKTAMTNFVNNRRWTNDQFSPQERIKCNMVLTLDKSTTLGKYVSTAQIQFVRPVYGATYETIILTFIDKNFDFEFSQGQPLDYNENVFISNIASMLSFYAYIALALDYDSFAKMGGSPHIEKAFALANTAQSAGPAPLNLSGKNGWENGDFNNRMALIVNLNNQQFVPFREAIYTYHREAMDKFVDNPDEARKKIIEALKKIRVSKQAVPINILTGSFFLAKKNELIQMFSKANIEMKTEVVNLLREIDMINSDAYSTIMKN